MKTSIDKLSKRSPGRAKGDFNGPVLVTNNEKVYRFKRYKGDDSCVTIFTDKDAESNSEMENKTREIYEKFWMQDYPAFKAKDKGEIFFADKDQDDEIFE